MKNNEIKFKEHCYKGNKIIEYDKHLFMVYYFTDPSDPMNIERKRFTTLSDSERWLDENGYSQE